VYTQFKTSTNSLARPTSKKHDMEFLTNINYVSKMRLSRGRTKMLEFVGSYPILVSNI